MDDKETSRDEIEKLVREYLEAHPGPPQAGSFLRWLTRTPAGLADLADLRLNGPKDLRAKLAVAGFGTPKDLAADDAAAGREAGLALTDLPGVLRSVFLLLSDAQDRDRVTLAPRYEGGSVPARSTRTDAPMPADREPPEPAPDFSF